MMQEQIIKTIQDLLLEYNYVAIPQLGGFVSKYKSAEIVLEKNIILPPSKKISFNANLKEDDGLLVNNIAKRYQLTVNEAEKNIKEFVKNIFVRLDEGQKVSLEKIGIFKFNQQLNIEFEVENTENYNPHSYGMVSASCIALTDNEIVDKKNKQIFTRSHLIKAAVILPFLIVGAVLSIYLNSIGLFVRTNSQETSVVSLPIENKSLKTAEEENPIAKEIDHKTDKKNALAYVEPSKKEILQVKIPKKIKLEKVEKILVKAESIKKLEIEKEKPVENQVSKEEVFLKYQLVAGSFKSKTNAQRLSKKIQKLDIEAEIIKMGHRYRVIAASYSNKKEAVKAKKSLKQQKVKTWINTLK